MPTKPQEEEKDEAFSRTFSVYQKHIDILANAQTAFHRRNLSDALQFILEDYARIKEAEGVNLFPTAPSGKAS